MSKRVAEILLTILLVFVVLAMAATEAGASLPQPAGLRAALRQGIDRAFNMDYPGADALLKKAVELDPEDPTGYAFQALNHLFGSEVSFDPKQREASQEAMLSCVGEALARGEQRVAKNPRDGRPTSPWPWPGLRNFDGPCGKSSLSRRRRRPMASGHAWRGRSRKTLRIMTAIC